MKKTLNKKIIILGTITTFFIFLMISFSFPDLFAMFYVPSYLTQGNIYSLVKNKKIICPWLDATWPPLYYLTIGIYINLIRTLGLIKNQLFNINSCPVWDRFYSGLSYLFFCCIFSQLIYSRNYLKETIGYGFFFGC